MTLRQLIEQDYDKLLCMAKSIDPLNYEDTLHDSFLKIKMDKEVNAGYLYFTMKSIFLDRIKKNLEIPTDFQLNTNFLEKENEEEKSIKITKNLTNFQIILLELLKVKKMNLKEISRETGISYVTIYSNYKKIKECVELEIL